MIMNLTFSSEASATSANFMSGMKEKGKRRKDGEEVTFFNERSGQIFYRPPCNLLDRETLFDWSHRWFARQVIFLIRIA